MWLDWEDVEHCNSVRKVEGSPCGLGYKGQWRKCDRSLGGKYCQDNGKEVKEDVLYRTTKCQLAECPGRILKLFSLRLSVVFSSPTRQSSSTGTGKGLRGK